MPWLLSKMMPSIIPLGDNISKVDANYNDSEINESMLGGGWCINVLKLRTAYWNDTSLHTINLKTVAHLEFVRKLNETITASPIGLPQLWSLFFTWWLVMRIWPDGSTFSHLYALPSPGPQLQEDELNSASRPARFNRHVANHCRKSLQYMILGLWVTWHSLNSGWLDDAKVYFLEICVSRQWETHIELQPERDVGEHLDWSIE